MVSVMGAVNSALAHLPEQKVFEKLRKLSSGTLNTYGKGIKVAQFNCSLEMHSLSVKAECHKIAKLVEHLLKGSVI